MMGTAICEEKGSGVDKVIQAIELHQLPAPEFRAGFKRFSVVLLAPRSFEAMAQWVRQCTQAERRRLRCRHNLLMIFPNRRNPNRSPRSGRQDESLL